ncbi:hypothetical protein GW915_03560 [bacterium]|nr:hypothetical protein [bacterium]
MSTKLSLKLPLLFLSFLVCSAHADKLNGIVGPSGFFNWQITDSEKATRQLYKFEFTRLTKHFGVDFRVGTGEGYTDYGGAFRLFNHIELGGDSDRATGITYGGGAGGMWSSLDDVSATSGENNERTDVVFHAFTRYIYDFGNNIGLGIELEYQFVPYTAFRYGIPRQIRENRHRILLGLNFLFDPGI